MTPTLSPFRAAVPFAMRCTHILTAAMRITRLEVKLLRAFRVTVGERDAEKAVIRAVDARLDTPDCDTVAAWHAVEDAASIVAA